LDLLLQFGAQVLGLRDIDLVDGDEDNLVGEEGADTLEERNLRQARVSISVHRQRRAPKTYLCGHRITTLFTEIHKVEDGGSQMSNCCNRLPVVQVNMRIKRKRENCQYDVHFNGVHLLERVIQNSRGINSAKPKI